MYRFTVAVYGTAPRRRVRAFFEQEASGKTQMLEIQGKSVPSKDAVRELSREEACQILADYVPIFLSKVTGESSSTLF